MYRDQTKHFRGQPTPIQGVGIPEPKFLKYMNSMKNRMNLEQFSNLMFYRVEQIAADLGYISFRIVALYCFFC